MWPNGLFGISRVFCLLLGAIHVQLALTEFYKILFSNIFQIFAYTAKIYNSHWCFSVHILKKHWKQTQSGSIRPLVIYLELIINVFCITFMHNARYKASMLWRKAEANVNIEKRWQSSLCRHGMICSKILEWSNFYRENSSTLSPDRISHTWRKSTSLLCHTQPARKRRT